MASISRLLDCTICVHDWYIVFLYTVFNLLMHDSRPSYRKMQVSVDCSSPNACLIAVQPCSQEPLEIIWILSVSTHLVLRSYVLMSFVDEYTDAECLDALYRVQMISPTAHASQKTSEQSWNERKTGLTHQR